MYSPLALARSSVAMTKVLLAYDADVKARDRRGHTTLHWAAGNCQVGLIGVLVEACADLEARTFRSISFWNGWYSFLRG